MSGFCADKQDQIDEAELGRKLLTITARWRPGDQQALALLERAAKRFFKARSENEVDLSGSMRAAFIIAENARLETSFVADIGRFERGDLPNPNADFMTADALLNSLYSKLMKSGVRPEMERSRQTESVRRSGYGFPIAMPGRSSGGPSTPPPVRKGGKPGLLSSASTN